MIGTESPSCRAAAFLPVIVVAVPHPLLLLHWIVCTGGIGSCLVIGWMFVSTVRRRSAAPRPEPLPALTILKPFDGVDPELELNLGSLLHSDYPAPLELLFCTDAANERGIRIVEALLESLPEGSGRTGRLLLSEPGSSPPGASRKTWHLQRGLLAASHPIVVVSDSSTRPDAGTLIELVATLLEEPRRGAAWTSYSTSPRGGLGARLAHTAFTATTFSFVVVDAVGECLRKPPLLVGGLLALRREAIDEVGGFQAFADYVTEDLPMARALVQAGWSIRRASGIVMRHLPGEGIGDHFRRLRRWNTAMLGFRAPLRHHFPMVHCAFVLSLATLAAALAAAPEDAATALGLSTALLGTRWLYSSFVLCWGNRQRWRASLLWTVPLNEAVMLAAFCTALFTRRLRWRGQELQLLGGGRVERV